MTRTWLSILIVLVASAGAQAQNTITTVAGGAPLNGTSPTGTGIEGPYGVVRDAGGNLFVFTDQGIIYKVTPGTVAPSAMSVYAGKITAGYSGDGGQASAALLDQPFMGTLDATGNLYFSDAGNCVVREINAATQVISTVAGNGRCNYTGDGGPATSATFQNPQGLAFDSAGNFYIADCVSNVIRKVSAGTITTYAGTGVQGYNDNVSANQATFNCPEGIAADTNGNLYIADTNNNVIRYVDATTLTVSTVVGTGTFGYSGDTGLATQATLRAPEGVALDGNLNLYVADTVNAVVRKVDRVTGVINTIIGNNDYGFAGDGGPALQATMTNPYQIWVDTAGDVWTTDYWNGRIRFYDANSDSPNYLTLNTLVGNGSIADGGPATQASLHFPRAPKLDASGNLYVTDTQNNVIREIDSAGNINIVAGTQVPCSYPTVNCGDGGPPTSASFFVPRGIAFDNSGNLIVFDTYDSRVREVKNGVINTIAGTGTYGFSGDGGPATQALLSYPWAGGVDSAGNIYVLDAFNNRVREINASTGNISTVAGSGATGCGNGGYSGDGGLATNATLNCPIGLDVDAAGDLYISDYYNFVIRRVDATTHIITTVAGTPGTPGYSGDGGLATSATLSYADRVSVNAAGNLFISDTNNEVIRRVDALTGKIETFAGNTNFAFAGDGGPALSASFASPTGVVVTNSGDLYVGDLFNNRVRKVILNAGATLTPATLPFGTQALGTTSAAQSITLTDSGDAPLAISDVTASGDFAIGTNSCGTSLAVGASCTVTVTFSPSAFGNRTGTFTVTDNAPTTGSTQTVALSGNGAASLTVTPAGTGTGAITSAPTGISCGTTCSATFAGNSVVTLTATPNSGSSFGGWSGGGCSGTGTCAVTLSANTTVTATFTAGGTAPVLSIAKSHTGNFTQGQANATYSVVVSNAAGAGPTDGTTVTVTETVPSGLTLVSMAGTGWTCAVIPTCTRTDALAGGASYPAITVIVNVGGSATSPKVNAVAVSGGGSANANTTDSTVIAAITGTTWVTTGSMANGRAEQTATLLGSGNVLVAGGINSVSGVNTAEATAEIYSVTAGTFSSAGNMTTARAQHTASLLTTGTTSGDVLLAGGFTTTTVTATAELFDPANNTFTATAGSMTASRYAHTATVLPSGQVLITGGRSLTSGGGFLSSAELFNPATGTFTATGSMTTARFSHTATLLSNGKVLIAGGKSNGSTYLDTAELYDPASGTFTAIDSTMGSPRDAQSATLLSDGTVLLAGGGIASTGFLTVTGSADIYNPATNTFTPLAASLSVARAYHTATLLPNGTVLLAGGGNSSDPSVGEFQALSSVEIYNPTTKTFSFAASLNFARGFFASTLLGNGNVLAEGGFNGTNTNYTILASAELYTSTGTLAPVAGLSPASLTFASQTLNTTSAAQTITLTNTGNAALTISGIALTGTNAGDFAQTNACPASLAANANCTISVTFKPTATGARTANVSFTDNAAGSPQLVPLTGTGAAANTPAVTFAPTSLAFASQPLNTTSAAQTITVTNSGTAALTISGVTLTGTNAGDFAQTNACPASLAANANCAISVTFKPTATGARTAAISVADNATGSPQAVPLTGTGAAANAPAVTLAPTSLAFGSQALNTTSPAQTVTLTNSGNAALTIAGISVTGANQGDFSQSNECPASLAAGSNCTISVTFKPTASGARTAAVSFADNATGSPQSVSLSGTGAATTPTLTVTPTSLTFASQTLNTTSAPQSVTVTNTGTSTVSFTSFTISGANSGDYQLGTGTCNPSGTLTAGANCTVAVTFTPTVAGTRSATLAIADNATGSPQSVSLTGVGSTATVVISVPSGGSTTATSVPGGTAYYGLIITGAPGVTGTVTLGCTPSSPLLTCSVIPSTVTLNGGKTEVAFGIQTYCQGATTTGTGIPFGGRGSGWGTGLLTMLFSLLFGFAAWASRQNRRVALTFAAFMLVALGSAACGGGLAKGPNGATPAGTYTLTLTTTFNGQTQTLPNYLTLIVQ